MGMAASQANFLGLTRRQHDIARQLTKLSGDKTALARESRQLSLEYNNALNTKKLKWSNNGGISYVNLSYNNLMTPNSTNANSPYLITNNQGKVVIDSTYEKYAEMLSADGKAGANWDNSEERIQILSELTGIDEEKIRKNDDYTNDIANTDATIMKLNEDVIKIRNQCFGTANTLDFLGIFGHVTGVFYNSPSTTSSIQGDYNFKNTRTDGCRGQSGHWSLWQDGNEKNVLSNLIEQIYNNASQHLSKEDAAAFRTACDTTRDNYNSLIDTYSRNWTNWNDPLTRLIVIGNESNLGSSRTGDLRMRVNDFIDTLLDNYRAAGGSVTVGENSNSYTYIKDTAKYQNEYLPKLAELEAAENANNVNKQNLAMNLDASEQNLIDFYDQLFSSIAEKGWVANHEINDEDYLNNMLQNGVYNLTTVIREQVSDENNVYDAFENSYITDLAENNDKVYKVNDSELQQQALAEYEYKKSIISEKESRIDTRMTDLKTEQSSIKTMMEGINKVKDDNIERTFNIFG